MDATPPTCCAQPFRLLYLLDQVREGVVATLSECIAAWTELEGFVPQSSDLPASITLDSGLLASVNTTFASTKGEKKEYGAGIGFKDDGSLVVGTVEAGEEASIVTSSAKTPSDSWPCGSFHTHPHADGIGAPSPADVWCLLRCGSIQRPDIFELVVTYGWYFLLIRTKDAKINSSSNANFGTMMDTSIQQEAAKAITLVTKEIQQEVLAYGIEYTPVHETVREIAYQRTLIRHLTMLKVGFYSGQSANLQRRVIG